MSAPIVPITIRSIYKNRNGENVNLPSRNGQGTPDMRAALRRIDRDVKAAGGLFQLSDLYRTYEMQLQAHMDYVSRKKSAYSPPPGGSMHESGRAFDVDITSLKMTLEAFWKIAAKHGVVPIIDRPSTSIKECWHFECRGSHDLVRQYYLAGKGKNMKASEAIAASAIVCTGVQVNRFKNQTGAMTQSALIRLGQDIGDLDGAVGKRSKAAIGALGITATDPAAILSALEGLLAAKFPAEWDTTGVSFAPGTQSDDAELFRDNATVLSGARRRGPPRGL
ncbi:MAG: hypothetical protein FJY37_04475 [Betaproteobacteria bacterium]|nr:hypothetical protein [Betaproteobacteria bacterium]